MSTAQFRTVSTQITITPTHASVHTHAGTHFQERMRTHTHLHTHTNSEPLEHELTSVVVIHTVVVVVLNASLI